MINYQFFPRSRGVTTEIQQIIDCFKTVDGERDSKLHLVSNDMLALLRPQRRSSFWANSSAEANTNTIRTWAGAFKSHRTKPTDVLAASLIGTRDYPLVIDILTQRVLFLVH